jgi:16S rRNA (cytosine967-C5)-methyltransferase
MNKAPSDRRLCINILGEILQHRGSLASAFGPNLKAYAGINAALVQEFCYGVCRWFHQLDYIAHLLLEKPLRNKDRDVQCLILLGLYQLRHMRTPAHAAINETVAEAERLGKPWAKNLVNAVLREAQRKAGELSEQVEKDYKYKYSHPEWLLSRLKHDWPAGYRAILTANNTRAPMTLRVNALRVSRCEYLTALASAGIAAKPGALSANAIILDSPCDIGLLPGFAEGMVSVQDESSQLVTTLLPLTPGLKVLDACAAPGGKTCALLESQPHLDMTALDSDERRISRIRENLERLGLNASVSCGDICVDSDFAPDSFDRILLDVPCSATGVIRRHPDIKLLRTPDEIERLLVIQANLLNAAWNLLKPGGFLLYSTCSTLKQENTTRLASFARTTANAESVALTVPGATACEFGSQMFPEADGHDGFFYALLRKHY